MLANSTNFTVHDIESVLRLNSSGKTLAEISALLNIDIETLEQFLPDSTIPESLQGRVIDLLRSGMNCSEIGAVLKVEENVVKDYLQRITSSSEVIEIDDSDSSSPDEVLVQHEALADDNSELEEDRPSCIYSYRRNSHKLYKTQIATGEVSILYLSAFEFNSGCFWNLLPSGVVFITGGYNSGSVHIIEVHRDFAVVSKSGMSSSRWLHCGVFYLDAVYVLGGICNDCILTNCERYIFDEDRWDPVAPLLQGGTEMSGIAAANCLYVMGGYSVGDALMPSIQRLSLYLMCWELLQVQLPSLGPRVPCFTMQEKGIIIAANQGLYFLDLKSDIIVKLGVMEDNSSSVCGPSYYRSGILYTSSDSGPASQSKIGELPMWLVSGQGEAIVES